MQSAGPNNSPLATKLVGAWRLQSTLQRFSNGTERPSPIYGPNGIGYLMYSASGHVCAVLTDPNRQPWVSEDQPTEHELRSSYAHFVSYCGRYEVREAEGLVVHHIELHSTPNNSGNVAVRRVQLNGSKLVLSVLEDELPAGMVEYILTWVRCD